MIGLREQTTGTFVFPLDPALDGKNKRFAKLYEEHLQKKDWQVLKPVIKPNNLVTIYHIEQLDPMALRFVLGLKDATAMSVECFAHGVVAIENFGRAGQRQLDRVASDYGGMRLTPEALKSVFAIEPAAAVSAAVIGLSSLDPTIGQG